MKVDDQAREFMTLVGQPTRRTPTVPPDDEVRLRCVLVLEEAYELLAASFRGHASWYQKCFQNLKQNILRSEVDVDLPKVADAFADIDYVVGGGRVSFGIDGEPILDAVHAANMAKGAGPVCPTTGKKLKPPGWSPPDIEAELKRQGWKP